MTPELAKACVWVTTLLTLINLALTYSVIRLYAKLRADRSELQTALAEAHHLRTIAVGAMARL